MGMILWDPFSEMTTLREGLDKILDETFPWRDKKNEHFAAEWPSSMEIREPGNSAVKMDEIPAKT